MCLDKFLKNPPQIEQIDDMVDSLLDDNVWNVVIICEYLLSSLESGHSFCSAMRKFYNWLPATQTPNYPNRGIWGHSADQSEDS